MEYKEVGRDGVECVRVGLDENLVCTYGSEQII